MFSVSSRQLHHETYEKIESGICHRRTILADTNIQRGIFQRDSISPLQFVIAMMPVNH